MQIVDADDRAVSANQVGRIRVAGPTLATGYVHEPDAYRYAFWNGWFSIGDLGYLDADGDLFIVDDRMVQRSDGSFIVFPAVRGQIENALFQLREVLDAGVCLVLDPLRGNRIRAVLELRRDATLGRRAIETFLRGHLDENQLPDEYLFLPQLPRTATGRIDQRALSALPSSPHDQAEG